MSLSKAVEHTVQLALTSTTGCSLLEPTKSSVCSGKPGRRSLITLCHCPICRLSRMRQILILRIHPDVWTFAAPSFLTSGSTQPPKYGKVGAYHREEQLKADPCGLGGMQGRKDSKHWQGRYCLLRSQSTLLCYNPRMVRQILVGIFFFEYLPYDERVRTFITSIVDYADILKTGKNLGVTLSYASGDGALPLWRKLKAKYDPKCIWKKRFFIKPDFGWWNMTKVSCRYTIWNSISQKSNAKWSFFMGTRRDRRARGCTLFFPKTLSRSRYIKRLLDCIDDTSL